MRVKQLHWEKGSMGVYGGLPSLAEGTSWLFGITSKNGGYSLKSYMDQALFDKTREASFHTSIEDAKATAQARLEEIVGSLTDPTEASEVNHNTAQRPDTAPGKTSGADFFKSSPALAVRTKKTRTGDET